MNYKETIQSIDSSQFQQQLREAMERAYPGHKDIDLGRMVDICSSRALALWRSHVTPDLDVPLQREFERNLPKINMRAGISIPKIFLFGYAFGAACHYLAKGKAEHRDDIGATCGLYMFILGLFDHLMDEFPDYFDGVGSLFSGTAIENYILKQNHDELDRYEGNPLAKGMVKMYQAYFTRCHRLVNHESDEMLNVWCEELKRMHRVEAESVDRCMSSVTPDKSLIEHAVQPSLSAFRVLAISATLEQNAFKHDAVEDFARSYATLSWLVDDVSDLQKDIQNDIWSGLAVRLISEVDDAHDVDSLIEAIAEQASSILLSMHASLKDARWQADDDFSLADVLWYVIWSWCGGAVKY